MQGVGARESRSGPATRTFLFTDIQGSTRTWQTAPDGMAAALHRHDEIVRAAVVAHRGEIVKHTGDGFLAVFAAPRDAAAAAVAAQRTLLEAVPFTVRMAVATGEAWERDGDWFGPALNRTARLLEAGHGGQVLAAAAMAALLRDLPLTGVELVDLGEHQLRDLERQAVFQLIGDGLPAHHPPLRTAVATDHTLPAARTPLVGREPELEELDRLLTTARMVTITGVGGVGKTRLALELATRLLERHPGGTFFAELAGVTDGSAVDRAVADAVGIDAGGRLAEATASAQLVAHLASRRALVVLDNCEHVLDEVAELTDSILDRCPQLRILATSREPLTVDGEMVWRAPSLRADGPEADAVRLFLDRAAAAGHDARRDDPELVADICRRLDGIPLAIELAAAQAAHLRVVDIAERLNDRFSLLTGARRRVQRQQTLLAAVEWSHDLLADDERILLRRLAVFPGWFTVDAVEAVCGDPDGPSVRTLGSLVSKSLVVAEEWRGRYRLLETIRLYAEGRIVDAGEAEGMRDRHRAWVVDVIERAGTRFDRTLDLSEPLVDIADDIRVALDWCTAKGDLVTAAAIVRGAGTFWWLTGRHDEGIAWIRAVMGPHLSASEQAGLANGIAGLLLMRSDNEEARSWAAEAMRLEPDPMGITHRDAELLLAVSDLAADPMRAWQALTGIIERSTDDAYFSRSARETRTHILFATDREAAVAEWEDLAATTDHSRRSIEDFMILLDLGVASHVVGHHRRTIEMAIELDRRGFSVWRTFHSYGSRFLRALGAAGLGDLPVAADHARDLVESVRRTAVPAGEFDAALACVAILLAAGEQARALTILGAVRGRRERVQLRTPISFALFWDQNDAARAGMDPDHARALYRAGRDLDVGELLDDVLATLAR